MHAVARLDKGRHEILAAFTSFFHLSVLDKGHFGVANEVN